MFGVLMGMNRLCAFPRIELQTPGKDWSIVLDWLCLHRASFRFVGTVLFASFFVRLAWAGA
jgi:hypothetical protein